MKYYFHIAQICWGQDIAGHPIVTHVKGSYDLESEPLVEKTRTVIERLIFNDKRIMLKHCEQVWQRGIELKSYASQGLYSLRIDYETNLDDRFPNDFPTYTK